MRRIMNVKDRKQQFENPKRYKNRELHLKLEEVKFVLQHFEALKGGQILKVKCK